MTEPSQPDLPGVAPIPAEGDVRALAFADVETAKRWVHGLPLASVALICETVQGQLKSLAAATFRPRERATIGHGVIPFDGPLWSEGAIESSPGEVGALRGLVVSRRAQPGCGPGMR